MILLSNNNYHKYIKGQINKANEVQTNSITYNNNSSEINNNDIFFMCVFYFNVHKQKVKIVSCLDVDYLSLFSKFKNQLHQLDFLPTLYL